MGSKRLEKNANKKQVVTRQIEAHIEIRKQLLPLAEAIVKTSQPVSQAPQDVVTLTVRSTPVELVCDFMRQGY